MRTLDDAEVSGRVPTIERELAVEGELTPSVAFRVLADEHRRFVLYLLVDSDGTVPVEDLAAVLGGHGPAPTPDRGLPSRVHRRLYHNHLPRLAEYGIVEYDRDAEAVRLTDRGEKLEPYLAFAREREPGDVDAMLDRGRQV